MIRLVCLLICVVALASVPKNTDVYVLSDLMNIHELDFGSYETGGNDLRLQVVGPSFDPYVR